MTLHCPLCAYTGHIFKPAGSVKTGERRRKLRLCPNCGADEWSRLTAAWLAKAGPMLRRSRILALSAPAQFDGFLAKMEGTSLVRAGAAEAVAGIFAAQSFDLVINAAEAPRDVAVLAKLHDTLKPLGWLIMRPKDEAETAVMAKRLVTLGFEADASAEPPRADIAVAPEQAFLAVRRAPQPGRQESAPPRKLDNHLIWYREDAPAPAIRPAPLQRDWMDRTPEKYAYRCLPLNIANAQGWELLNTSAFTATWDGAARKEGITLSFDEAAAPAIAMSHFGSGILTFSIRGLFRTPPGIDLMMMGPINRPKAGIQALTGVIETDWSPFGFTMNWLFTDKDRPVRFDRDEPFAALLPVPRGLAESFDPVIMNEKADPDLWRTHMAHRASRADFIADLRIENSAAREQGWQRGYFTGPDASVEPEHRTKVRLRPFRMPSKDSGD
jgi:Family of unknown function (DUF6065)